MRMRDGGRRASIGGRRRGREVRPYKETGAAGGRRCVVLGRVRQRGCATVLRRLETGQAGANAVGEVGRVRGDVGDGVDEAAGL